MGEALTEAGWKLTKQPAAADLDWKRWLDAPIVPLPTHKPTPTTAKQPTWTELPATTVVLGLSPAEREQLADVLVAQDREAVEAEGSLGYREYDEPKRRAEIVAGLAVSLGHSEVEVSRCEIMASPVTNSMWSHYMAEVGAQRPASWAATLLPLHDPVTGISYDEAAQFAAHHGWTLPTEAEWQLAASRGTIPIDGANEYTADPFVPYPGGDPAAFATPNLRCLRGTAAQVPPCIPARRGLAHDHRFKFARFRCVRRS
jgi:formylglycine-generating enzyme required for sulfatase activity